MAKRILMLALICFGVLLPAGVTLKADDSASQTVISFRGKANWALATMPSPVIQETDPNPPSSPRSLATSAEKATCTRRTSPGM